MKRKYSMTYYCEEAVTEKSQEVYKVYLNMVNIVHGFTIRLVDEVIVPMTTFNISLISLKSGFLRVFQH
jgi:hypothetical protein